jgi:tRNA threonylcarbamoyl adenosine modification protein YeaZ
VLTLAFDTATSTVTVAVSDGAIVLAEVVSSDERRHGEVLAPSIATVLGEAGVSPAELSVVAVGVGPGPFTGLRVGLVTARTLGLALGVPVVGVCTLDLIAAEAAVSLGRGDRLLVATDARRKEVYWATYEMRPELERIDGPHVSSPSAVDSQGRAVGGGALLYPEVFPDAQGPAHPQAATLCRWVAQGQPTLEPLPLYLRRPDAAEPAPRKRVSGPVT